MVHVYPDRYHGSVPSHVVATSRQVTQTKYPPEVSPMSTDECSPDDSGYLGQVNHYMPSDRHVHYAQYPSRHTREHNTRSKYTNRHGNKKNNAPQQEKLTWRMDPAQSLSDFKLVVIGTSDHSHSANMRSSKMNSPQQRRQKWNVDGLYLDMSGSEDEGDECKHADIERRECEQRRQKYSYSIRKEYHLHRVNLAVGPRSCEYFALLFRRQQQGKVKDEDSGEHAIELPVSCLGALPIMLDYIYASPTNEQVQATAETAVSLRYLATVFGNRSLFDSATNFIRNDLRPETAITYLLEADLYRQKKLRNVCMQICAEEFDQIKIRHLAMIPPHLLESILYSSHFNYADSYSICSTIAAYCRCQESNINGPKLLALTDASVMPEIYPEEALFFIKTMLSLGMNLDDNLGQDHLQCKIRSLYERCIGAAPSIVHEVLDSFCHSPDPNANLDDMRMQNVKTRQNRIVCADYRQLPPQVKVDLLEYALAKHQNSVQYGSI